MLAVPVASAIGTPLAAWLIQTGHGTLGLAGWRFMMICVGLPAVLLGVVCWFYLTDRPADAHWLTDEQRHWLIDRLSADEQDVNSNFRYPLRRTLTSPRVWALALVNFAAVYGLYALAFFLPSIVAGFRDTFAVQLSLVQVGLITAVPYAFGAVAMYLWSRHADRTREHVRHLAVALIVGGLAIPVALYLRHPYTVMITVTIAAIGIFGALPVFWALPTRFLTGAAAAGGIALINSVSNLGGFAAPYITGALHDLTGNDRAGMWAIGVIMLLGAALVVWLGAAPTSDGNAEAVETPRSQPSG
jgi:MFS family permease